MAESSQPLELGIRGVGAAEHVESGSFADVYKAPHETLGLMVAVKILRSVVPEAAARLAFEQDCQVMAEVSEHPNLVNVYTGGLTASGLPYLVSDWFAGGSLAARLERQGPMRPRKASDLITSVAEALEVAHGAGVLHRDIKPSNILLTRDGQPALGDVGIARLEGRHQVASMRVPAGFLHTAPEVLEGQEPTEASDIYSLGSTLFEILVGRAAYYRPDDDSVWPLMKRALSQPFPEASTFGVYEPLSDLIQRATARNRADRFGSVSELLAVLRAMSPPTADIDPLAEAPIEQPSSTDTDLEVEFDTDLATDVSGDFAANLDGDLSEDLADDLESDLDLLSALGPPESERGDQAPPANEQLPDPAVSNGRTPSLKAALLRGAPPDSGSESSGVSFEERIRALRNPPADPVESLPLPDFPAPSPMPEAFSVDSPMPTPALPAGDRSATASPPPRSSDGPELGSSRAEQELHDLLSEDESKSRRPRSVGSNGDGGPLRGILIGLLAAAVLGLVAWQFWLSDRQGAVETDFSGPNISLPEAASGPLETGEPYAVTIADSVGADAQYRFVVDGAPIGEPEASPPSHVALAGRHELQLEVISGGTTSLSPPVSYYGSTALEPGYRAHLAVVEANPSLWPQALEVFDALVSDGHDVELLVSDQVAGVSPGRWLLAVGGFGPNGADADAYCAEAGLGSPEQCWAGFVESSLVG